MTETCNADRKIEHGERCDCVLLARALHLDPASISFEYCQRVLRKHWRMTCRHGAPNPAPSAVGTAQRWREVGPVDAVKAILISNEPQEA